MANSVSRCESCDRVQKRFDAKYCEACGEDKFSIVEPNEDGTLPKSRREVASEILQSQNEITMFMSTLSDNSSLKTEKVLGIVYGTSSKMALGWNKQSTRLELATTSAMLDIQSKARSMGANAIVGISVALNSSQGASAVGGGSSDAVLIIGTAVITK